MGNGYAITAVVGTKEVMECAQSTFISSTFWTERIGPSAALKTLEVMKGLNHGNIFQIKKFCKKKWNEIAKKHNLDIEISGISPLPIFNFKSDNKLAYKTLVTQEMLKKASLLQTLYICVQSTLKNN